MTIHFKLIAAACENMGIGKNNALPWKLPKEMAYFQRMTTETKDPGNLSLVQAKQNAVIMGRKTWDSIPTKYRPMKNRVNIVLSKKSRYPSEGAVYWVNDLDGVAKLINENEDLRNTVETAWIVGGTEIYKAFMDSPFCHSIYLTKIKANFECDTFFPSIPLDKFELARAQQVASKAGDPLDIFCARLDRHD